MGESYNEMRSRCALPLLQDYEDIPAWFPPAYNNNYGGEASVATPLQVRQALDIKTNYEGESVNDLMSSIIQNQNKQ